MITVEIAREILGTKYTHLTDDEVERLIGFLTYICNKVIDEVVNSEDITY